MRIYKQIDFAEWADDEGITDEMLKKSVEEVKQGLIDASLGAGLYKKRIARQGQGKSAGCRVLFAFRKEDRAVFIYGFAKNEQNNISSTEKNVLKDVARYYLNMNSDSLTKLIGKELIEVL